MVLRLAGCVILDKDRKILLLHRNKNPLVQWELPGGKVDKGENDQETAVRELKEELDIDVEIVRQLGSAEFEGYDRPCYYVWFLARPKEGDQPKICEPQTFDALNYFAVDELDSMQLSPNMVNLLKAIRAGEVTLD